MKQIFIDQYGNGCASSSDYWKQRNLENIVWNGTNLIRNIVRSNKRDKVGEAEKVSQKLFAILRTLNKNNGART